MSVWQRWKWQHRPDLWPLVWRIVYWRWVARFFGAVADVTERFHDRLHPTTDSGCDFCLDRENES